TPNRQLRFYQRLTLCDAGSARHPPRRRRGVAWMLPSLGARSEGGDAMSQVGIGMVIDTLLTEEKLRIRFAVDRISTVTELFQRGFDLSPDDIDLFCRTDADLWFLGDTVGAEPLH